MFDISQNNISQLAGHLFRHEAGKMAAVLSRLLGSDQLQVAEDIVQDTLMKAMDTWGYRGIPENPSAWLYTVAKNKALDFIRKKRLHEQIHSEIGKAIHSEWALSASVNQLFLQHEIEDSQLRMMFVACHPVVPVESQIALTLKILGGLSVREIASSFLTNEETIQKRIARAKERLREECITIEVPSSQVLSARIDAVLKVLYLLFNEGYHPSQSDQKIREELCEEAMRLTHLLLLNPSTSQPKVSALMALMCFQASRFDARSATDGLITLEHQDRSRWNNALIGKGVDFLEKASVGNELSEYHLEAAIASAHAKAVTFADTNWKQILYLYTILSEVKPGPIVELNRAITIGYAQSFEEGLAALQKIDGLHQNPFYFAALGNFFQKTGNEKKASVAYLHALNLTNSRANKDFLKQKLDEIVPN